VAIALPPEQHHTYPRLDRCRYFGMPKRRLVKIIKKWLRHVQWLRVILSYRCNDADKYTRALLCIKLLDESSVATVSR
jgi:hypothetical protein